VQSIMQNYYSKYMSHVTNTLLPFNKYNKCSLFIHVTSPNVNRQILFILIMCQLVSIM